MIQLLKVFIMNDMYKKMMQQQNEMLKNIASPMEDFAQIASKTEQDTNQIDDVITPGSQRLKEASDCIHNRYAKTFQRLAKE